MKLELPAKLLEVMNRNTEQPPSRKTAITIHRSGCLFLPTDQKQKIRRLENGQPATNPSIPKWLQCRIPNHNIKQ
jgi:hypothetical protein